MNSISNINTKSVQNNGKQVEPQSKQKEVKNAQPAIVKVEKEAVKVEISQAAREASSGLATGKRVEQSDKSKPAVEHVRGHEPKHVEPRNYSPASVKQGNNGNCEVKHPRNDEHNGSNNGGIRSHEKCTDNSRREACAVYSKCGPAASHTPREAKPCHKPEAQPNAGHCGNAPAPNSPVQSSHAYSVDIRTGVYCPGPATQFGIGGFRPIVGDGVNANQNFRLWREVENEQKQALFLAQVKMKHDFAVAILNMFAR